MNNLIEQFTAQLKNVKKRYYEDYDLNIKNLGVSTLFYYEKLVMLFFSTMKFENAPEGWDIDYLMSTLFLEHGLIGLVDYEGESVCLRATLNTPNVYGRGTQCIITGVHGEVYKGGFSDKDKATLLYAERFGNEEKTFHNLIWRYAILLADCDTTLSTSLVNSRIAHWFKARNPAEVKAYKKMYDAVTAGEGAIFEMDTRKGRILPSEQSKDYDPAFLNVKNTFIGNDILLTHQSIYHMFLSEIGINNSNTQKRERLNSDEVNSNNQLIYTRMEKVEETINMCLEKFNKKTGHNVIFSIRTLEDEEVETYVNDLS